VFVFIVGGFRHFFPNLNFMFISLFMFVMVGMIDFGFNKMWFIDKNKGN
jgi:hypothetical protein